VGFKKKVGRGGRNPRKPPRRSGQGGGAPKKPPGSSTGDRENYQVVFIKGKGHPDEPEDIFELENLVLLHNSDVEEFSKIEPASNPMGPNRNNIMPSEFHDVFNRMMFGHDPLWIAGLGPRLRAWSDDPNPSDEKPESEIIQDSESLPSIDSLSQEEFTEMQMSNRFVQHADGVMVYVRDFPGKENMWVDLIEGDEFEGVGRVTTESFLDHIEFGAIIKFEGGTKYFLPVYAGPLE